MRGFQNGQEVVETRVKMKALDATGPRMHTAEEVVDELSNVIKQPMRYLVLCRPDTRSRILMKLIPSLLLLLLLLPLFYVTIAVSPPSPLASSSMDLSRTLSTPLGLTCSVLYVRHVGVLFWWI